MPGKRTPEAATRRLQKKLKHDADKALRELKSKNIVQELECYERVHMALGDLREKSPAEREADWMAYAAIHYSM